MTSACTFKDARKNDVSSTTTSTCFCQTSSTLTRKAVTSQKILLDESESLFYTKLNRFWTSIFTNQFTMTILHITGMFRSITPYSSNADVFMWNVNRESTVHPDCHQLNGIIRSPYQIRKRWLPYHPSVFRSRTLSLLNRIQNSNEPTMPHRCGRHEPIIPPSLKDINLPFNPFNIPATMALVQPTERQCDERKSPNHRSSRTRLHFRRPRVILAQLKSGRLFGTPERSIWRTSYGESISFPVHPSATVQETKEEIQHGDVLLKKRGIFAACLRSLSTSTTSSKRHPRPFHRLKLDWIDPKLKVFFCIFHVINTCCFCNISWKRFCII